MISLTKKEREALLVLFKDFTSYYNANSISNKIGISHVGAQKIFKRLKQENLVVNKKIGKAIIYKINFEDKYVRQLISFLLADEANNFKRWKEEFEELFIDEQIVMIYGSAIKNYSQAKDIDLMIASENMNLKKINKIIAEKQKILPKKIHAIKLTEEDLLKNLKIKKSSLIEIIKNAIILNGQNNFVDMMKNVTST